MLTCNVNRNISWNIMLIDNVHHTKKQLTRICVDSRAYCCSQLFSKNFSTAVDFISLKLNLFMQHITHFILYTTYTVKIFDDWWWHSMIATLRAITESVTVYLSPCTTSTKYSHFIMHWAPFDLFHCQALE